MSLFRRQFRDDGLGDVRLALVEGDAFISHADVLYALPNHAPHIRMLGARRAAVLGAFVQVLQEDRAISVNAYGRLTMPQRLQNRPQLRTEDAFCAGSAAGMLPHAVNMEPSCMPVTAQPHCPPYWDLFFKEPSVPTLCSKIASCSGLMCQFTTSGVAWNGTCFSATRPRVYMRSSSLAVASMC